MRIQRTQSAKRTESRRGEGSTLIKQVLKRGKKLTSEFYKQEDVVDVSQKLLGKFLVTDLDGRTAGMIVETEAYRGPEDRAAHSYGNRRTERNEVMYWIGGFAYVYLCYGIHHLFNVVTGRPDHPHAVLIRAVEPAEGIDLMLTRRNKHVPDTTLTSGPGSLTQALGISTKHTRLPLKGPEIWIEDRGVIVSPEMIIASPRVGINYAGKDARLPWRFRIRGNPWTSPAK